MSIEIKYESNSKNPIEVELSEDFVKLMDGRYLNRKKKANLASYSAENFTRLENNTRMQVMRMRMEAKRAKKHGK